jgi:GntR family transcriptional regulator
MVRFRISTESPVPPSAQLYEQLTFAIASRQLPLGARLPSVRQLSMQTGLHRNTISKVYNQLEATGLVSARAGSGVYVLDTAHISEISSIQSLVRRTLDTALSQGYTLQQITDVVHLELDRRLRETAQLIVTSADPGSLSLMVQELETRLGIPVQGVPLHQLAQQVGQSHAGLVVTQRYDYNEARSILQDFRGTLLPLDIYTYKKELEMVEKLPSGQTLGVVSLSPGILRIVEIFVHSLRGQEILVLTAQLEDTYSLNAILQNAHLVMTDESSFPSIQQQSKHLRIDRSCPLPIHCVESYIAAGSILALKAYIEQIK